jgi:hypothetical protein
MLRRAQRLHGAAMWEAWNHLLLANVPIMESEEVTPGVIVDHDASIQVLGIELRYLSCDDEP